MMSASDAQLIEACAAERRCLVTLDLDFANPLRFPPERYAGVVVLRLGARPSASDIESSVAHLARALESAPVDGKLWVIDGQRVREFVPRSGR